MTAKNVAATAAKNAWPRVLPGTCAETDNDGDEIYSTFQFKGSGGTHTFVGGTGKYAGLSGTADFTAQSVKSPDGRGMVIVRHKATWQRP